MIARVLFAVLVLQSSLAVGQIRFEVSRGETAEIQFDVSRGELPEPPPFEPAELEPKTPEPPTAETKPSSRYALFLTQSGCPPCLTESSIEFPKLRRDGYLVDEIGKTANLSIIDIGKYPAESTKHRIVSTPTHILFEDGKEIGRYAGYLTASQFKAWYHKSKASGTSGGGDSSQGQKKSTQSAPWNPFSRAYDHWYARGQNMAAHVRDSHGIDIRGLSAAEIQLSHNACHEGVHPSLINAYFRWRNSTRLKAVTQ